MKLNWTFGHLTTEEADAALEKNCIPSTPWNWTEEQMERAIEILDAATALKRCKALNLLPS